MSYPKGYQQKTCHKGHLFTTENVITRPDGTRRCKICQQHYASEHRKKENLRFRFGLTVVTFQALVARQNGHCAICWRVKPLGIDHDHVTGRVRGLLCSRCNSALGYFQDSEEVMQRAIIYVSGGVPSGCTLQGQ